MKLIKVINFLFFICFMQVVFSDNLHFDFYYGESITNVTFDYAPGDYSTATGDKLSVSTGKINNGYQVTVTTNIDNKQNSSIYTGNEAVTYNNMFTDSSRKSNTFHLVQLTATESGFASNLDFWVGGSLYINNELVASDFTFGHNNSEYTGNSNWWIASNQGTIYLYQSGLELDLQNADGSHHYCLSQYGPNYQVNVVTGTCSSNTPYDNQGATKKEFLFKWHQPFTNKSDEIKSVTFTSDGNYDDMHGGIDYFESISYIDEEGKYHVYVKSNLAAESGIASSFINKFNSNTNFLELKSSTSSPTSLDYWVEGSLTINDQLVASDVTIALDANSKTWWIGSNSGQVKNDKMLIGSWCLVPDDVDVIRIQTADKCN